MSSPTPPSETTPTCHRCGAPATAGASFCESCGGDLGPGPAVPDTTGEPGPGGEDRTAWAVADPVTATAGEESPLDVGWTGPVARETSSTDPTSGTLSADVTCRSCGEGTVLDGYCDVCGSKAPDPREHYDEEPAPWVAGVCDIGRRHRRNEDALALHAQPGPLSFAVLVVCDGVSNTVDSDRASLAASRAARAVLADPLPHGVGTRASLVAAARGRLDDAVEAARAAVVDLTPEAAPASGPASATASATEVAPDGAGEPAGRRTVIDHAASCTFVAAVVSDGVAVVGNVGDSRAYWLPDDPARPALQLTRDDSYAHEQVLAGVPREEAETGPGAHAITRWLGVDSPDDLTPHTADVDLDHDGWLLVCSDGLWNYCSDATALQAQVHRTVADLGVAGHHPLSLAQALTDWANACGGIDNVTVALARVGETTTDGTPSRPDTKDTP